MVCRNSSRRRGVIRSRWPCLGKTSNPYIIKDQEGRDSSSVWRWRPFGHIVRGVRIEITTEKVPSFSDHRPGRDRWWSIGVHHGVRVSRNTLQGMDLIILALFYIAILCTVSHTQSHTASHTPSHTLSTTIDTPIDHTISHTLIPFNRSWGPIQEVFQPVIYLIKPPLTLSLSPCLKPNIYSIKPPLTHTISPPCQKTNTRKVWAELDRVARYKKFFGPVASAEVLKVDAAKVMRPSCHHVVTVVTLYSLLYWPLWE